MSRATFASADGISKHAFYRTPYLDLDRGNHPAGLNGGDCFAYALAKATGEALLFMGADFARTDIRDHGADST